MLTYSIPIGPGDESLEVRSGFLVSTLRFRGSKLKPEYHAGFPGYHTITVQTADGASHAIESRQDALDVIPQIIVDGAEVAYRPVMPALAKALTVLAWALLPMGVCVVGGWSPAFIGLMAGQLVLYLSRAIEDKTRAQVLSVAAVIAAWLCWVAFAIAGITLFSGPRGG